MLKQFLSVSLFSSTPPTSSDGCYHQQTGGPIRGVLLLLHSNLVSVHVGVGVHACHSTHVEAKGQWESFHHVGFGHQTQAIRQASWQTPLPPTLPHWLL